MKKRSVLIVVMLVFWAGLPQAAHASINEAWECVFSHGGFEQGKPVKRARQACQQYLATHADADKVPTKRVFHWKKFGGNPVNRPFKNKIRHKSYAEAKNLAQTTAEKLLDGMLAQAGETITDASRKTAEAFIALSLLDETIGLDREDGEAFRQHNIELRLAGKLESKPYGKGAVFEAATFGNAESKGRTEIVWSGYQTAHVLRLNEHLVLPWFPGCGNATLEKSEQPMSPKLVERPERPSVPGMPEVVPAQVATYAIDWDLWASGGGVYDSGSHTHFGYVSGGVYPLKHDFKNGRLVAGIDGFGNWWQGYTLGDDPFHFRGNRWGVGPGVKYYNWEDGYDIRFSSFYGQYADMGRNESGQYQSRRSFDMVGADMGFNYYDRQRNGEAWFPKTQVWLQGGAMIGRHAHQSWEGQSLGTGNLRNLGGVISAGVRQFIYDFNDIGGIEDLDIRTFASLELFTVTPETINLGPSLGANWKDVFWCWAGPNINLRRGGNVSALWTCGVDAAAGVRLVQKNIRQDNFGAGQVMGGLRYDERTGILYMPSSTNSEVSGASPKSGRRSSEASSYDDATGVLKVD